MPNRVAESTSVFPIFFGGSFGFSFSNTEQLFWTQPQFSEGFGESTWGQVASCLDILCDAEPQDQEAPADSGQELVINQLQSWSVLQETDGLDWGVM